MLLTKNRISLRREGERGAAMMIAVIFFIVASVLVVLGLTGPSAREFRTASDAVTSRQSYFLAESGAEDVFYRFKNSITLGSAATLTIPEGSVTTTIAPYASAEEEIQGAAAVSGSQRAVDLKVDDGTVDYDVQSWVETR